MTAAQPDRLRSSPSGPLHGCIEVPGDKSISHRALILGALADGETRIEGLLESADVLNTARAVQKFGAEVHQSAAGAWRIVGAHWRSPDGPVDCGNSGTGVRLLMGAASGFPIEASFTGDASLQQRPMKRVLDPLRAMGAQVEERDTLPVTLRGGGLHGIAYRNVHASAQVKSAVLLAGLHATGPVEVLEPDPSRDHTEQMLRQFGCDIEITDIDSGRQVRLGPNRRLRASHVVVPGDPSSAAFLLVAALVTPGSEITLKNILDAPLRSGLLDALAAMGADIRISNRHQRAGSQVMDITARSSNLKGATIPASGAAAMIDEYPILAVAAAFAEGDTVMEGLSELRVKESDRLAAIASGLSLCGVQASTTSDSLHVQGCGGTPRGGAFVPSHGDHRIAMAFLVLGLAAKQPVIVDDAAMIATSFPVFAQSMAALGANIEPC